MKRINRLVSRLLLCAVACGIAVPSFAGEPEYGTLNTEAQHPDWIRNAVIYEVNLRQGTLERTLAAMEKQLPRLQDLGVDILWLMPIHPISKLNRKGELGSYYAVADYKAVNPEFGTFDDLRSFVKTAHRLGMKVIIDEVCNHTGCDNVWVKEHPDFYARNEKGEMFGPFDWTDTYKLDYSNPQLRAAMIDALEYWVKEADIDGYRCDVAAEVPTSFWEEARVCLDRIKPVFMLAEASKAELTIRAFDADYNWPMKDAFNAVAATQGVNKYAAGHGQSLPKSNARTLTDLLVKQHRQYPQGAINMNMITNHDLNSWEGTEFDRYGEAVNTFAVLSYTLPGMPMMYTGQEVGWNHAFEFFKHDQVPVYKHNEYTVFYRMLNALKHDNKALAAGVFNFTDINAGSDDVMAFQRTAPGNEVTVIANLSGKEQPLHLSVDAATLSGATEWFSQEKVTALPAKLSPWQYIVLVK